MKPKQNNIQIPLEGYSLRFKFLKNQIIELLEEVILSEKYTGRGNRVICLEKVIKELWGTTGIATSSGTISLKIALMCAGIKPGDEVIVPSLTFVSTAYAVNAVGAIPVFVDIDPKTLTINPDAVLESITSKTVAIIPVHLYGQMADMQRLLDIAQTYNLKIIEDCAQAHGATYNGNYAGSLGDFGCFSFYHGKNVGGLEDSGMITMKDPNNVSQVLRLCDLGRIPGNRYNHEIFGLRGRMGEFTAALITLQLKFLAEWNQRRNYIANYYNASFNGLPLQLPFVAPGRTHVYYQYTVITDSVQTRQKLEEHLNNVGIETMRIYPQLIPDQPAYQNGLSHRIGKLTIARAIVEKLLSLPIYPELDKTDINRIVTAVQEVFWLHPNFAHYTTPNTICCYLPESFHSPALLRAIQRCEISLHIQSSMVPLPKKITVLNDAKAVSLIQDKDTAIISNREASLSFILEHLPKERLNQVNAFKNKAIFRQLFKELSPDLWYQELTKDALRDFQFPAQIDQVVLKPSRGAHSIGIRIIHGQAEWARVVDLVLEDINRATKQMNSTVVSDAHFLVEEFIDGEEFACDGFWDKNGKTIITGIYQHPFLSNSDVRDTVYYTAKQVVAKTIEPTMEVMNYMGAKLGMRRFPFHFEFRLSSNGTLFPIELNPLRFGGNTLPELMQYAFGFNPYELFFTDKSPDWNSRLAQGEPTQIYASILGYLPPHYTPENYRIDEESFCHTFGNRLLNYFSSDPTRSPFFGIAHIVADNVEDVLAYLHLDFERFIYPCEPGSIK